MKTNSYKYGFFICLISAILFSSKGVVIKLIFRQGDISSIGILTLRMLISFPFYFLVASYMYNKEKAFPFHGKEWIQLIILGLLGYYAASFFDFWGLEYVSVFIERIVIFSYPTIVLILSIIFLGKKAKPIQIIALVLTYFGTYLAFRSGTEKIDMINLMKGGALVFISALSYAFYMVFGSKQIAKVGSIKFTCYALMVSTGGVVIHYLLSGEHDISGHSGHLYLLAGFLAIFGTVIPTFLTAESIRIIGPGNAAIVSSLGPVSTMILGYFILGDKITILEIAGTIFVIMGVLLIGKER